MEKSDPILSGKYPAKSHAANVGQYLRKRQEDANDGIIYLEGQKTRMNEDNDQEAPFRQRRYFHYLSGCDLPDSYLIYNLSTQHLTLFIPPIDPDSVIWSGLPLSPHDALKNYDVDEVRTSTDVASYLERALNIHKHPNAAKVWAIEDQISTPSLLNDAPNHDKHTIDLTHLKHAIEECRVIKDSYEIALIKHANAITTLAHTAVLQAACTATNERELEAIFIERCIANGSRTQAYDPIVASGTNAATLHYVSNDAALDLELDPATSDNHDDEKGKKQRKKTLLLDAGAEYKCYASDVTRTYPLSHHQPHTFDRESLNIYNLVLRMQKSCLDMLKAGSIWDEIHAHAHYIAIAGLLSLGILRVDEGEGEGKDDTKDEAKSISKNKKAIETIFAAKTSVAFFPHGLGHYLGLDTHDTGGRPNYSDPDPMYRYLRVRGPVPAGSVITVEPGIYFCRFIIEPYLADPSHRRFINEGVLERYWGVGGVRIEG
ncbi:hypothetical protein MMC09_002679 [Bachmanniomyces sp. S44760]|nr:hypothetical protein [Bachmanniomyces sp. S44760]